MVELDNALFHARMDEQLRDPRGELFWTPRFWHQRQDARCHDVFGCDIKTLKRAVAMLKLAPIVDMGPDGRLDGCERAFWHLCATGGDVLEGWAWEQQHKGMNMPARLKEWQNTICEALSCRLRTENIVRVRRHAVVLEWAGSLSVNSERQNAHGTTEAARQLHELLGQ